jgi:hypothetical protein
VAAPDFVTSTLADQPRRGLPLPAPDGWVPDRVSEVAAAPSGLAFGRPGPDQGFGLKLARRFADRLVLQVGESSEDAVVGCLGVGLRRASIFGRAPVVHDFDIAFRIWGFLGDAPTPLLERRRLLFESAAHHYEHQRAIADAVPESTLRLAHGEVARRFPAEWQTLLAV